MWFCKKVWKKENLLGLTLFICLLAVVGSKSNNSADIRTIVVDKGKNNNIVLEHLISLILAYRCFYFNILFRKKKTFLLSLQKCKKGLETEFSSQRYP